MNYYYTDPLEAAYMAKYHGMEIVYKYIGVKGEALKGANISVGGLSHDLIMSNYKSYQEPDGKFYIHPDSLKILEPQEGDLVEWLDSYRNITREEIIVLAFDIEQKKVRIIQRNGRPFFMPIEENATQKND